MIPTPRSRWFHSHGLRLHLLEWGAPDAPPLLLVHGGRDHARSWDGMVEKLLPDWRLLVPDLRGHGDSDWVSDGVYSIDGYIADLAQLVEETGMRSLPILAHSLGGRIALRYAGIFPDQVSRLVVIEGLGLPPDEITRHQATPAADRMRDWVVASRVAQQRSPRRYASLEAAAARMSERNPRLSSELVRHLTETGTRRHDDGGIGWKFDPRVGIPAPIEMTLAEMESIWRAIACPVLLLHGSASFLPDPRLSHRERQFADASIVVIPDAGHWVHHDRLDEVTTLTRRFLTTTEARN